MGGAAREGFQANAAPGPANIRPLESEARRPSKPLTADYVPAYRNTKLAVVEARAWAEAVSEGVVQAKNYAGMLAVRFSYSSNGWHLRHRPGDGQGRRRAGVSDAG